MMVTERRPGLESLTPEDIDRFEKLRIPKSLLQEAQVCRITDSEARTFGFRFDPAADLRGNLFPYFNFQGECVTARLRRDFPERDAEGKEDNKYVSAYGDKRHLYFGPTGSDFLSRLNDRSIPIIFVEAEKSVLSLIALSQRSGKALLPIGTGGCWGWRGRIGKKLMADGSHEDERGPLPDLDHLPFDQRDTIIAFDSNTATNEKVREARDAFASELRKHGATVRYVDIPVDCGVNGPDDYVGNFGDDAMLQLLKSAAEPKDRSLPVGIGREELTIWPTPDENAFYGVAGDAVRLIEPHSESDPVAILVQFLLAFGNVIGRRAHYLVEADKHFTNLFAVIVGATSKGRKGTSWGHVKSLFGQIAPEWESFRRQSGLSSGEGLIHAVRDAVEKQEPVKENGRVTDYQTVIADEGVEDKRLLVVEPEFASTLRVINRDGNTLSPVIRNAWDDGNLRTMTKSAPEHATGAHISIIGHITSDELRRYLTVTETANGFANRFIWLCVRRSKCLPEGGNMGEVDTSEIISRLRKAVDFAATVERVQFDELARKVWYRVYPELSGGGAGLFGAVTSRAEAQVVRLALIYALLDCSNVISATHLTAALALWEYAEQSASYIFGQALGYPDADLILTALRNNPTGLSRTDISGLFGRHRRTEEIERALSKLSGDGRIRSEKIETGGKSAEIWKAI
jgi:hypothetical protein